MIDSTGTLADSAPHLAEPLPASTTLVPLKPALDLGNYPVIRQLSMTEHDCDLVSRVLGIVLTQCESSATAAADPVGSLSASWLRDEIKRLGTKFATAVAAVP